LEVPKLRLAANSGSVVAVDKVRVLVVDDAVEVRRLLAHRLPFFGKFEVVGEAADAAEAIRFARQLQPDLIVLDQLMPGRTGLAAAPELRAAVPQVTIVLFTSCDVGPAAARTTVDAVVDKAEHPRRLEEVILRLFPAYAAAHA
jgi:DNA-binding NarL/FixJ family response regulator